MSSGPRSRGCGEAYDERRGAGAVGRTRGAARNGAGSAAPRRGARARLGALRSGERRRCVSRARSELARLACAAGPAPGPWVGAASPPVARASEPLPSVPPVASGAPSTHAAAPAIDASSSLSAERELLDRTRAALTAEDPDRALSLLSDHARRFARPQLGEEREALAIQALANAGRYDEARERGARFRAARPNSLFLPAVDATLASIP